MGQHCLQTSFPSRPGRATLSMVHVAVLMCEIAHVSSPAAEYTEYNFIFEFYAKFPLFWYVMSGVFSESRAGLISLARVDIRPNLYFFILTFFW